MIWWLLAWCVAAPLVALAIGGAISLADKKETLRAPVDEEVPVRCPCGCGEFRAHDGG